MAVEADLARCAVVATEADLEAQKTPEVVNKVLECAAVLLPRVAKTSLDVVPDLADLAHIFAKEPAEALTRCVVARTVIEFADES